MKNFLKNKTVLGVALMLCFWVPPSFLYASDICSKDGYSLMTINGMLADENAAIKNKENIKKILPGKYKNQNIYFDYIYNKSHSFTSDFIDSYIQKMTEGDVSYTLDFKNMLLSLSQKLKTQKVLFVAHSQGNFYANDIYNSLSDKDGGISVGSMAIYGIGTPTSYIAGGGRYILSKNDEIINKIRLNGLINVLPPNVDIPRSKEYDMDGHSLSLVYLKKENKRIASDILSSLNFLSNDRAQDEKLPCVNPPQITKLDNFVESFFYVVDPAVGAVEKVAKETYEATKKVARVMWSATKFFVNTANSLFASPLGYNTKVIQETDQEKNLEKTFTQSPEIKKDPVSEIKNEKNKITENDENKNLNLKIKNEENGDKEEVEQAGKEEKKILAKNTSRRSSGSSSSQNENQNPINPNPENNNPNPGNGNPNLENPPSGNGGEQGNTGGQDSGGEVSDPPQNPTNKDTVAPVIRLEGDLYMKISKGYEFSEPGVYASDNVDGVLQVSVTSNIDKDKDGIYFVKYRAEDKSGNFSERERTVEIYTPLPSFYIDEDTELPAGEYFYDNLVVTNGATLKILSDTETPDKEFRGVKILANNITIDSGAKISSVGTGYFIGPGTTEQEYFGGSHGGDGNFFAENYKTYGSAIFPKDLGSNGSAIFQTYKGGGAIWIEAKETLQNNGTITSAGGTNSSGGSVYVKTKKISGDGSINANGGGGSSGNFFIAPGGGGRVAVYFEDRVEFTGVVEAKGGCMSYDGYSSSCSENGTAGMFDLKNKKLFVDSSWVFSNRDGSMEYREIYVSNSSKLRSEENAVIDLDKLYFENYSGIYFNGTEDFFVKDLSLKDNSFIETKDEVPIEIKVDDLYIDQTSKIDALGRGYLNGPGAPEVENYQDTSASYGGKGAGINPKPVYGDENNPNEFGSGSGSFRGGGLIKIKAKNNILNDGLIIADGYRNMASGGAVNIEAGSISGSGRIFARGSESYYPYVGLGGGGGRILLKFKENNFSGEVSARGGYFCFYGCAIYGGEGTVRMIDVDEPVAPPVVKSDENKIIKFEFKDIFVSALIDDARENITASVESDVDISNLVPTIEISPFASVDKQSLVKQDFSNPVVYTVTSESGINKSYTVLVSKKDEGSGGVVVPDTEAPFVKSFSLDGTSEDITTDPFFKNVNIEIFANEPVDWVSVEIENIDNTSLRKLYYSGASCEDGTDSCLKVWNGMLSGANTLLEEGVYRVNVHMKDLSLNDTLYTLPSVINVKRQY